MDSTTEYDRPRVKHHNARHPLLAPFSKNEREERGTKYFAPRNPGAGSRTDVHAAIPRFGYSNKSVSQSSVSAPCPRLSTSSARNQVGPETRSTLPHSGAQFPPPDPTARELYPRLSLPRCLRCDPLSFFFFSFRVSRDTKQREGGKKKG